MYQRGPSYWKLNEEILKNNASLIRDDLQNFFENESPSSYENFKHIFRELPKFIQESKNRVGQKTLKIVKSLENVLRDCIHGGKGPNPSLIEKIIWFPSKRIFQIFEKFRKLSAILLMVYFRN